MNDKLGLLVEEEFQRWTEDKLPGIVNGLFIADVRNGEAKIRDKFAKAIADYHVGAINNKTLWKEELETKWLLKNSKGVKDRLYVDVLEREKNKLNKRIAQFDKEVDDKVAKMLESELGKRKRNSIDEPPRKKLTSRMSTGGMRASRERAEAKKDPPNAPRKPKSPRDVRAGILQTVKQEPDRKSVV